MLSNTNNVTPATAVQAPPGRIAAFFDMDHTLLRESSGRLYLKYLLQTGHLRPHHWLVITFHVARYMIGLIDFPRLMSQIMTRVAATGEAEAWRISDAWFETMLRHYIADRARERIAWHQGQGHHVAIVSASTPYAVELVARSLGVDYLATRLEIADGRFTGRLIEPACYGVGKVILAAAYAKERGAQLDYCYFYSDSYADLPLLEAVGHPVAVNPSRKLARIAVQRGWPITRFY